MENRTTNLYQELSVAGAILLLRGNDYTLAHTADILNTNSVLSPKGKTINWTAQRVAKVEKDFIGLDYDLAIRAMELSGLDLVWDEEEVAA